MDNLAEMVRAYSPETFLSVKIDRLALKVALGLSLSEAIMLETLLREYQSSDFPVKAVRQHIHNLRRKLEGRYGLGSVVSMGVGFYAIPDNIKAGIQADMEG